jgi:hypothetical protein
MQNTIAHQTFVSLSAKANTQAALVSSANGWTIQTRSRGHTSVLTAQKSKAPRVFRRMETATEYLRKLGVLKFVVEMAEPITPQTPDNRKRPDRRAAMQQTHQSASDWDAWFASQVEAGLKEADSAGAQWVTNDEVKTQWAKRRAKLLSTTP